MTIDPAAGWRVRSWAALDPAAGWRVRSWAALDAEWRLAAYPALVVLGPIKR